MYNRATENTHTHLHMAKENDGNYVIARHGGCHKIHSPIRCICKPWAFRFTTTLLFVLSMPVVNLSRVAFPLVPMEQWNTDIRQGITPVCLPACPRGVKRNNEIVATPTNLHITWTNKQESSKIYIVQLLCAHGVIPSFLSYFSYFLFATRPLGHRDGSGWAYMTSVGAVWRSSARVSLAFKFNRSISIVMKKIPSVRCS